MKKISLAEFGKLLAEGGNRVVCPGLSGQRIHRLVEAAITGITQRGQCHARKKTRAESTAPNPTNSGQWSPN